MPREESIAETAKQRSLRVPLDHYVRPDPLVRTKWLLSTAAAAVAILYFGWCIVGGRSGNRQVSPGLVAAVHGGWNDDCQACHTNFQPLRADAVNLAGLISGPAAHRESLDQGCIKCHNTPVHHAAAKPAEVPSCAACHREHQGRMADIVRPSDTTCLSCHRDIEHHRNGPSGLSQSVANVWSFGLAVQVKGGQGPHPDFRSLQSDPGNIKFNHWLHMQPGIATADSKQQLKLSDLGEDQRPRYAAYAKTDNLLQLDCAACHQPDASGGQSMQPIVFEQHCRACHSLQLKNVEGTPPSEVPHGLSAARLTAVLDGLLFVAERNQYDSPPPTSDESGAAPLIPGKTLGSNLAQKINQDVLGRRASASRAVLTKCQQCHYPRVPTSGAASEILDVLPANIPATWLRHARFDHSAHRHVECRICHEQAYAFEQRDQPQFIASAATAIARDDEQIMIAGLESCAKCHSPQRGSIGGARHDCAECHNYHGGDHLLPPARSSFPGSSLGTHVPEAPASSALPGEMNIHLAAFSTPAHATPNFVGASSCSSAGCHGSVHSDSPLWQTAFTTWAARDPHARAYDVLWTFRAREMTRLLSPDEPRPLSDQQHLKLLKDRCLGCHATPAPSGSSPTLEDYSLGVHCESCHGAAGSWAHNHYQKSFSRTSAADFIDTKTIAQRAAACMKCHVGPSDEVGQPQAVDHDLIAAGHPRLAFEFHSYFQSLPPHWGRRAADERHQSDAFHFRSWLAGQKAESEHRKKIAASDGPVDFSQLDCFACHHHLAPASWRHRSQFDPLKPLTSLPIALPDLTEPDLPLANRFTVVRALFDPQNGGEARWDRAVQAVLASRALAADVTPAAYPRAKMQIAALQAALSNLDRYLAIECFSADSRANRRPTQYDSPTTFDPEVLQQRLAPLRDALQYLEAAIAAP